jgi:hypothetical protein
MAFFLLAAPCSLMHCRRKPSSYSQPWESQVLPNTYHAFSTSFNEIWFLVGEYSSLNKPKLAKTSFFPALKIVRMRHDLGKKKGFLFCCLGSMVDILSGRKTDSSIFSTLLPVSPFPSNTIYLSYFHPSLFTTASFSPFTVISFHAHHCSLQDLH